MFNFIIRLILRSRFRKFSTFFIFIYNQFLTIRANIEYNLLPTKIKKDYRLRMKSINLNYLINKNLDYKKICLFASYSNKLNQSTKLYIKFINDLGYKIIHVNNLITSKVDLDYLSELDCICFDRKNIGRDIGAFKDAFLFLEDHGILNNLNILSFANDSVQFIPGEISNHFGQKILDFEKSESPALFTHSSQEFFHHYQSFFCILKNQVFLQEKYIQFWKKYKPLNDRTHSIHNGEILLSRLFYNKLHNVTLLFSTKELVKNFDNENISFENENTFLHSILPFAFRRQGDTNFPTLFSTKDKHALNSKIYWLAEILEHSNTANTCAFIFPYYLSCPFIKNNICFSGSFSFAQAAHIYTKILQQSLSKEQDSEKLIEILSNEFYDSLIKQGNPFSYISRPVEGLNKGLVSGFKYPDLV